MYDIGKAEAFIHMLALKKVSCVVQNLDNV